MVTKDEALKMAIEALDTLMMEKGSIYQQAIQACKEALEHQSNMVAVPLDKLQDMQRKLKALEQPAQSEYVVNSGGTGTELRQPAQKWVGLSDLEIAKIISAEWWKEKHKFAKAIEAKLKELNHGS